MLKKNKTFSFLSILFASFFKTFVVGKVNSRAFNLSEAFNCFLIQHQRPISLIYNLTIVFQKKNFAIICFTKIFYYNSTIVNTIVTESYVFCSTKNYFINISNLLLTYLKKRNINGAKSFFALFRSCFHYVNGHFKLNISFFSKFITQ